MTKRVRTDVLSMTDSLVAAAIRHLGHAPESTGTETVQTLWKGYGAVYRAHPRTSPPSSIIVKHIIIPPCEHDAKDNEKRSTERKRNSYLVETNWYRHWGVRCDDLCRIPRCLCIETTADEIVMVLEDLDAAGFPRRAAKLNPNEILSCLRWLAEFHAIFLGEAPTNLWRNGTYWHLDTRPDELFALEDTRLKHAASAIDAALNDTLLTVVHGDAKVENFCFSADGNRAAAVDFQYVGQGCGMKDLAYFVSSCMDEDTAEKREAEILDRYFDMLRSAVRRRGTSAANEHALESAWRPLYRAAWVDFHRFYKAWSGLDFSQSSYSERIAKEVIDRFTREEGRE